MYYANEVGLKSSQTPSVTESRSAEVDAPVSSAQHDALTVPLPHERIQKTHISFPVGLMPGAYLLFIWYFYTSYPLQEGGESVLIRVTFFCLDVKPSKRLLCLDFCQVCYIYPM